MSKQQYLSDISGVYWVDDYKDGYAWFMQWKDGENLAGVIDHKQRVIIQPVFKKLKQFSEGLAGYYNGVAWGFINKKGVYCIPAEYYDITDGFVGGLCAVRNTKESRYGYINKKGFYAIPPIYDFAFTFNGGLAKVVLDGQFYFIDKRGRLKTKALCAFRGV